MAKNPNAYDLILQDNGSKEFFLFSGLTDLSENHLYHQFDIDLSSMNPAEYTYVVLINNRTDVEYDFKTPLLSTIIHTGDGDIELRDLQPGTGLLRVGDEKPVYDNQYDESGDNKTIFYYDN